MDARRAILRGALLVLVAAGLSGVPAQAHPARDLRLRLPGRVTEATQRPGGSRRARGVVSVTVPSPWVIKASDHAGTVGHLEVQLAGRCQARLELDTWIGTVTGTIDQRIQQAMGFWFYSPVPPTPAPVSLVAKRSSISRSWAIGVPPALAAPTPSPFFGILTQRIASSDVWGALQIGVRTTPACGSDPPRRTLLLGDLGRMLETATFRAWIQ